MTPLNGIKVLEVGSAIAAPLCGMILSEMGADVIKVEDVDKGDDARYMGVRVKGESLYFFHYNKNKRSIALNLKSEKGREIFLKLVEEADVLVENFRPNVMARLSLSYDDLKKVNGRLVYCSISGFGQTGPYSKLGGYDVVIQGMAGIMSVTGSPDGEPLRVGIPVTDILAAINAAAAICAALYFREKTGRGTYIDVSLFESAVAAMGQWISTYVGSGQLPLRFGNKYPPLAPYEPFKASDGWLIIAVGNEEQWQRLCLALDREDLYNDPRFRDNQSRTVPLHREILTKELEKTLSQRSVSEWVDLLQRHGIPSGPINTVKDLLSDPQVQARNILAKVNHPLLGEMVAVRTAPFFEKVEKPFFKPSPLHGEHTVEILKSLGYSEEEIEKLEGLGVVKTLR